MQPVLVIERFSYAYPGRVDFTLRDVSLRIGPGECHLLEGPTGSGKSTLLKAIRGLLPPGRQEGEIRLQSRETEPRGATIGFVQQNPKTQLLCASLGADIAFGLENHCVDPTEMEGRVEQALKRAGLDRPLHFSVDDLSMGQQYRACIAGQLVMEPPLLLLDEPVAQLDPSGREKVIEVIRQVKRAGGAILICEHRAEMLRDILDRSWQLDTTGRLKEIPAARSPATGERRDERGGRRSPAAIPGENPVIRLSGLKFANDSGELDLSALDFTVAKGECIALCGANGSGKTTLIRAMAGMCEPVAGMLEVCGAPPRLHELRGRLSILFQDPVKQLFESTVLAEVLFTAQRGRGPDDQSADRVEELLRQLGLDDLAQASPHLLSYGQKHLVGLAAALAGRPEVLLLDDPLAGLDRERAASVMHLVAKVAGEQGTTVLWTTHDPDIPTGSADRVITLSVHVDIDDKNGAARTMSSDKTTANRPASRKFHMSTGVMLLLSMVLAMLAFGARTIELLVGLGAVNLSLLLLFANEPLRVLKKSGVLLFWQGAFIVLLYICRFGPAQGLLPGGQVALQLFLAFWPGMIFMSANSQPRIVRALSRVLPPRTAFVCATCLRFLPMLLTEMQQIREVQILRGARILVSDLKNPRYWPDWLRCLLVPTLIKTLALSEAIATAAMARDFDLHPRRTNWPGD